MIFGYALLNAAMIGATSSELKVVYQFTWPSVFAAFARSATDMLSYVALDALEALLAAEEPPQAATLVARPRASTGATAHRTVRVLIRYSLPDHGYDRRSRYSARCGARHVRVWHDGKTICQYTCWDLVTAPGQGPNGNPRFLSRRPLRRRPAT